MERHNRFKIRLLITAIFSIAFVLGCVSKENVKVPLSDPLPHPKLAQMQSLSIEKRDGVNYFGKSRKYEKRGITVVSLKGDPYEIGYAHGVLLKNEMKPWFREALYFFKNQSYGTSLAENKLMGRTKEIEQYIPEKYITEIKGLAAGSGIDYDFILMLNTAATTGWKFFCTSVAVKMQDGKLIRSRSFETSFGQMLKPHILFINQPSQGYAFASVMVPGIIGTFTAMNETGLNFGPHAIKKAPTDWKGSPNEIVNRQIIENADSVEEVGEILKKTHLSRPRMIMVTDSKKARIYEHDSENIGYKEMDEDRLILTNYTQVLKIGVPYYCTRYHSASNFLKNHQGQMDVSKLVELNRSSYISRVDYNSRNYDSYHLAIFMPETLDFWIAVDPAPASRGRWVGFNLKKELDGSGHEPNPLIIPAMSGITIANNIKINEKEPWTGIWKVESSSQGGGIWAMKQEGDIVESTRDSAYDYKGKVRGNQLKGNIVGASRMLFPFVLEMSPDGMSFKGTADMATSKNNHIKGRRIE